MSLTDQVTEFHKLVSQPIGKPLCDEPGNSTTDGVLEHAADELCELSRRIEGLALTLKEAGDTRLYRAHLVIEEASELVHALMSKNEVCLADAIGDLMYVAEGTAVTYDIPTKSVLDEIHRSNMTKSYSARDPRMRTKGPDYKPPDIAAAIQRGRELAEWNESLGVVE